MPPRKGKSRDVPFLDPVRLAVAAMDRIHGVAKKSGRVDSVGQPLTPEARAELLAIDPKIPPSFVAALSEYVSLGPPERLYTPEEIRAGITQLAVRGISTARFLPIGEANGNVIAFDRQTESQPGELAVVIPQPTRVDMLSETFAHWLDNIADEREEQISFALGLPDRLARVLADLGFRPDDSRIFYALDTSDLDALGLLLGARALREARGDAGRLFDATGRAHLTLDAYDFSLTATLRVGDRVFGADDVFRWLRAFRDEDFLGRGEAPPSHPDRVRDLRRSEPEESAPVRSVFAMHAMAGANREFVCGAGGSADRLWVVAQNEHGHSILYTVEQGKLKRAQRMEHAIRHLHVTASGELWATGDTQVFRFSDRAAKAFPIRAMETRPPRGLTGNQPLVWGPDFIGGFDGDRFPTFEPDPSLTGEEEVRGVVAHDHRVYMLVCGDMVGAIACFDGTSWLPVEVDHMMEGDLVALDRDEEARYVLDAEGAVFRMEIGRPRVMSLPFGSEAFMTESRDRRPLLDMKITAWGMVFASTGGIIVARDDEAVFYEAPNTDASAQLARLGEEIDAPLLVTIGPHVWVWDGGAPTIVDTRKW